jgi:hypothetical protein
MLQKLDAELRNLPDNFIIGIVAKSDSYNDVNIHVLDFMMNKKKSTGSYITVSKPYVSMVDFMKRNNLNSDKIHFIDCISKTLGGRLPNAKNCDFVSSPSSLTEIGIALHKYVSESNEKNRFLHIDSLSTLSVHNDFNAVLKFVHYLTGKMRVFGLNGVMISLHEESDKKLISELGMFCDKIVHV